MNLNNRKMGFWDMNLDKDVLHWDMTMCGIFGFDEFEKIGTFKMFSDMVHKDDLPRVASNFYNAVDSYKLYISGEIDKEHIIHYDTDYRVVKPSGEESIVNAFAYVIKRDDGIHVVGVCDDVTERNKLLDEIERLKNG